MWSIVGMIPAKFTKINPVVTVGFSLRMPSLRFLRVGCERDFPRHQAAEKQTDGFFAGFQFPACMYEFLGVRIFVWAARHMINFRGSRSSDTDRSF